MTTAPRRPRALSWLAALADTLAQERPGNQTHILAVAVVLVLYSNADGTHARVGQRRIASETGLHLRRVTDAHGWLVDHGWVEIGEKRGAHGVHDRTLTIPPSVATQGGNADEPSVATQGGNADEPSVATQGGNADGDHGASVASSVASSVSTQGGNEPTDLPDPGRGRGGGQGGRGAATEATASGVSAAPGSQNVSDCQPLRRGDPGWSLLVRLAELVDGLDVRNGDVHAELVRLADGGWSADDLVAAWQPMPTKVRSPARLALHRLSELATKPGEDVALSVARERSSEAAPVEVDPGAPFDCQSCLGELYTSERQPRANGGYYHENCWEYHPDRLAGEASVEQPDPVAPVEAAPPRNRFASNPFLQPTPRVDVASSTFPTAAELDAARAENLDDDREV